MINKLGAISLSPDILEKANIGLWAFELDEGKAPRMYVDTPMLGLIGLKQQVSPEETYHAWYDHIDESSYGLVTEAVEKMISGEHAEVQYPWHHPDGHILVVRCGGVRNFNYTAGVRIEGTHQDVTEVIHFQEEKIAEQETFNRYFLEPYEAAYYVNIDTLKCKVFKRSNELEKRYPVIGNFYDSFGRYINTEIHPDDRERISVAIQHDTIKRILKTQQSFSCTYRKISEEKERLLQCVILRGCDESHIVLGFTDVSEEERKKKEFEISVDLANQQRHIKAFGDMVNAALWSMDISDGDEITAVSWSDEFRHMFGFTDVSDFPNTIDAWSDRLHPDDKKATLDDFWSGIRSKNTESFVYDIKYRILRKTGDYCWYHALGRMEETGEGNRRMYGIITDISSEKKIEEQQMKLEDALAMAQSANKAKTAFLNNMSHDIRTPMNAIIGYTGLAKRNMDNREKVKGYLSKIEKSSEHLLNLINDVLDMSRIESGKMIIEEKPENITDIIDNLKDMVQADVRSKHHSFVMDTSGITHENVICDKLRLNQVLLNIISNSIKYTANGGRISLRITEETVKKDEYATYGFCIKDNGMGMTEDFIKTIFEPFKRANSSTMSGIQGTGLGMAITKNIVDMMGGRISIRSELGKGTETTVEFEFRLQNQSDMSAVNNDDIADEHAEYDFTGKKVLLVEDNEINREIAGEFLNEYGFVIDEAQDGETAVMKMKNAEPGTYDIVLMDVQMPGIDGYEATRQIRAMGTEISEIPIIAMTANAFEEDRRNALEAGMNDHVAKPINMDVLKATIAKYIFR